MALDKATYESTIESALNAVWSPANLLALQADLLAVFTSAFAASSGTYPPATPGDTRDAAAVSIAATVHKYVVGGGAAWPICRLAHTIAENTTFAGGTDLLIDNVTVFEGDRILVTGQVLSYNNGIYVVVDPGTGVNGTWVRADDLDVIGEVSLNDIAFVATGDTQASSFWKVTAVPPVSLAAGVLTFTKQAGPPAIATLASALADANDAFVKSGSVSTTVTGTLPAGPVAASGSGSIT
jgi:hypothetical protein